MNLLKLPDEIVNEIEKWKLTCDKIKNSPLKHLKEHDNVGTKTNYYQTSVPVHLIESSYWLPFTLRSCAKIFGGEHRNYYLKNKDETIFIDDNYKHNGKKGDMLLFPSDKLHKVDIQKKDYERITFAFNINYRQY